MGITGLLPFIKNSCRSTNIREYSGASVAIDAYSWLHKGAFSCADKLAKGEKTDGYVFYCLKLLNMLLEAGVKPIMVFDGCNLCSKEGTEKKRRENREKAKQRGKELLCEGRVKEAREYFQRCVDVTPEMAREVIEMCRKKSIECIVAPYEADAQLAYLNKIGVAEIVITEDSDLVLFGCNKILFKMDSCGGGFLYEKENLPKSFGANASKFCFEKFRYMCILSGCDYLPSLPGIGLAKACKFFMLTSNTDLSIILSKLPSYLKMPKLIVTEEYKESFMKANNTFLYQLVFCPKKKTLVPLNTYPEGCNVDEMEYAGKYLPDELACQLAMGNINVKTLKKFDSISNSCSMDTDDSMLWGTNEKKPVPKKEITAFKFASPKTKSLPVKRKHEELIPEKKETKPLIDEELLSMYGGPKLEECNDEIDTSDEDPIPSPHRKKHKISPSQSESPSSTSTPCKNISNLALQRIVKSRFFVKKESLKSVATSATSNPPLEIEEQVSKNSDSKSCNSNIEQVVQEDSESEISYSFDLSSPKKCNKENINRFAKKKLPNFNPAKSSISSTLDIASTPSSIVSQKSLLDVIDSESSVANVTSCEKIAGKACEILCETSKSFKDNIRNKFSAKRNEKKFKLVSTKILDFKLTKESDCSAKLNHSLGSDGNTSYESLPEGDSVLLEESPFSPVHEDDEQVVSDSALEKSISVSSDSKTVIEIDISDSKTSEYFSAVKPKLLSTKGKSSKCRQIGLSKNRKHKEQKVSKKETLLNFNFVRKPKNEVEVLV